MTARTLEHARHLSLFVFLFHRIDQKPSSACKNSLVPTVLQLLKGVLPPLNHVLHAASGLGFVNLLLDGSDLVPQFLSLVRPRRKFILQPFQISLVEIRKFGFPGLSKLIPIEADLAFEASGLVPEVPMLR